jgi:hypothetical protein
MAYSAAEVLAAASQAYFGTATPPTAKNTQMVKAISDALVEVQLLNGLESTTGDMIDRLWFRLAMYEAGVVALGHAHPSVQNALKDYQRVVDAIEKNPPADATAVTTPHA